MELAARVSYLDFSSPNLPLDTNGFPASTKLVEVTLGTNWYLNSFTRMMFNYTAGIPDIIGSSPTVAHTFGLRATIDR